MSLDGRWKQRDRVKNRALPDPAVMTEEEIFLAISERWRNRTLLERFLDWLGRYESPDGPKDVWSTRPDYVRDYKRAFGCYPSGHVQSRNPFPWREMFDLRVDPGGKLLLWGVIFLVLWSIAASLW